MDELSSAHTLPATYSTGDKNSFAYVSARDRWPVILTGAIDDVHKAVSGSLDQAKRQEGKKIIADIANLKYELQHDRTLNDLVDDGEPDIAEYNKELHALGYPTWFNVPWLFSECYLYRRMAISFTYSENWQSYDVFARKKLSTFHSSRSAVVELACRYQELIFQIRNQNPNNPNSNEAVTLERNLFMEVCEVCLWGNATDLSLLTSLTYENIQKLQVQASKKSSKANILVDDLASVYDYLRKRKTQGNAGQIDIILDNSGFELYVDLILAGFLLSTGLASNIVLHSKMIPWFVSDVVPMDLKILLNILASPQAFFSSPLEEEKLMDVKSPEPLTHRELDALAFVFQDWSMLHSEGQLLLRTHRYWTESSSFWHLPSRAPQLYADLKESTLVIFKGDLNYRKLTGDALWDPTTPFIKALGPMGSASGVNILSLRTCKSDVIVGLKEGEDEKLRNLEGGGGDSGARKWAWNGKWAVISFSEGKS